MPHVEVRWKDSALYLGRKVLAGIEPDQKYPQMWRVRLPDGRLSGMLMLNRTRAKDAAQKCGTKGCGTICRACNFECRRTRRGVRSGCAKRSNPSPTVRALKITLRGFGGGRGWRPDGRDLGALWK
jgi:hypothetical protein